MSFEQLKLCVIFVTGAAVGGLIATGQVLAVVLITVLTYGIPTLIGFCTKWPCAQKKTPTRWEFVTGDPDTYFHIGRRFRRRLCHS